MKAAILKRYQKQSPKVVIQDVGLPQIGPHQVLLKTLAVRSSSNDANIVFISKFNRRLPV